jgi:nitrogen fixation protein NifU and related proteins
MDVEEMYQEIILDHYRAKHFSGLRDPYEAEVHHVNPTCGDEVTLRVHLADGKIGDVSYSGAGCSISQASTSVMAGLVREKTITETLALHDEFLAMMQSQGEMDHTGHDHDELEDDLEDGIAFLGVAKFPARIKCALLGWSAFKDAVIRAEAGRTDTEEKVI